MSAIDTFLARYRSWRTARAEAWLNAERLRAVQDMTKTYRMASQSTEQIESILRVPSAQEVFDARRLTELDQHPNVYPDWVLAVAKELDIGQPRELIDPQQQPTTEKDVEPPPPRDFA